MRQLFQVIVLLGVAAPAAAQSCVEPRCLLDEAVAVVARSDRRTADSKWLIGRQIVSAYAALGKIDEAISLVGHVDHPIAQARALGRIAVAIELTGDAARATEFWQRAWHLLERNPKEFLTKDAAIELALDLVAMGRRPEALRTLDLVGARMEPGWLPMALGRLARRLQMLGDPQSAEPMFISAVDAASRLASETTRSMTLQDIAHEALNAERYELATKIAADIGPTAQPAVGFAARADTVQELVYLAIASALASAGKFDVALEAAAQIKSNLGGLAAAIREIAGNLVVTGTTNQQDILLRIDPLLSRITEPRAFVRAAVAVGAARIQTGDAAGGQQLFDTVTRVIDGFLRDADKEDALVHFARALAESGDFEGAVGLLRTSIKTHFNRWVASRAIAAAAAKVGNVSVGLDLAAEADHPNISDIILQDLAFRFARKGAWDQAAQYGNRVQKPEMRARALLQIAVERINAETRSDARLKVLLPYDDTLTRRPITRVPN